MKRVGLQVLALLSAVASAQVCRAKLLEIAFRADGSAIKVDTEDNPRILDLSWRNIRQLLPAIAELPNLRRLDLSCNELESLPDELTALESLEWLVLSANKLTSLPRAMGQLQQLRFLNMAGNCFETVPAVLAALPGSCAIMMSYGERIDRGTTVCYQGFFVATNGEALRHDVAGLAMARSQASRSLPILFVGHRKKRWGTYADFMAWLMRQEAQFEDRYYAPLEGKELTKRPLTRSVAKALGSALGWQPTEGHVHGE